MKVDTKWTLTNYSQACLWGLSTPQLQVPADSSDPGLGPGPENQVLFQLLWMSKKLWKRSHGYLFLDLLNTHIPECFPHTHCFSCSFENNVTLHLHHMMQLTKYFTHIQNPTSSWWQLCDFCRVTPFHRWGNGGSWEFKSFLQGDTLLSEDAKTPTPLFPTAPKSNRIYFSHLALITHLLVTTLRLSSCLVLLWNLYALRCFVLFFHNQDVNPSWIRVMS